MTAIIYNISRDSFNIQSNFQKFKALLDQYDVFINIQQGTDIEIPQYLKKESYLYTKDIFSKFNFNHNLNISHYFDVAWYQFYEKYPAYDYYWIIEDDVSFSGSWSTFFDFYLDKDEDLIASHIFTYPYNNTLRNYIKKCNIYYNCEIYHGADITWAFFQIARFSNRALKTIIDARLCSPYGHAEIFIPTLLKENNFSIRDIGCQTKYAKGDNFITPTSNLFRDKPGSTLCWSKYSWSQKKMTIPNKVYHPCKH